MNILVNFIGTRGAGPVFSIEMVKGLLNNGCNVFAIISDHMENFEEWEKLPLKKCVIKSYKTKLGYLFGSIFFPIISGIHIKKYFENENFDCIYIPMIQMWSYKINKLFPNTLKVVTVHDPEPHSCSIFSIRDVLYNSVCKKTINKADRVVILSETFRKVIKEKYHFKDTDIVTIPHGRFSYYKNIAKRADDNYDDKIHFLFFGRIEEYKGLNLLYDSYALIEKKYSNKCDLRIVGSGNFSEYANKYNQLKNVEIINRWINDEEVMPFFRKKNTVLVIPYIKASQSGVIPIAMEAKCPIIATNVGGLCEQIQNKRNGLLCEPNVDSLYKMLEYSINNMNECLEMVETAYMELDNLNWDKLAYRLLGFIKDEKCD